MARASGRSEDQEYRDACLRFGYRERRRQRDRTPGDARDIRRRQGGGATTRRPVWARPGAVIRVGAAERSHLELLGEQRLAGQPSACVWYTILERRNVP